MKLITTSNQKTKQTSSYTVSQLLNIFITFSKGPT